MAQERKFEAVDAKLVKARKPLLVGITSPSGGGKTFSALTLAAGMQRVLRGKTKLVDTEAGRSLHYKDMFDFQYVAFPPPHSPDAYEQAIRYCISDPQTTVIVVDSMSHEHTGDGGVLDQIDEYMTRKSGGKDDDREKYKWAAQIEPKRQRKSLNNLIEQLGGQVAFIFCYRANDKTKPGAGGKAVHMGWTAETTSTLPYMMTIRFLMPPGSEGRPNLKPDTEFEKLATKMPIQFKDWFKPGLQLTPDLGERLARWSLGEEDAVVALIGAIRTGNPEDMKDRIAAAWKTASQTQRRSIKSAVDTRKAEMAEQEKAENRPDVEEDKGDAPSEAELAAAATAESAA